MGKRSQSKNHWRKRKRSEHIFSTQFEAVVNGVARMFRTLSKGLTRPDKAMLRKQIEERK